MTTSRSLSQLARQRFSRDRASMFGFYLLAAIACSAALAPGCGGSIRTLRISCWVPCGRRGRTHPERTSLEAICWRG